LYFPASSSPSAPAGIDILSNDQKQISDEIMVEIRAALAKLKGEDVELGKAQIFRVGMDGSREEERKEKERARYLQWEKRTGPEVGISPDLTYDD
jgi:hypothetical protein